MIGSCCLWRCLFYNFLTGYCCLNRLQGLQSRVLGQNAVIEKRLQNEVSASRRAKQKVRGCCKTIGAGRMVTLTYRDNMIDREKALRDWKAFLRRLGKVIKFHYVAVIEEKERGALHFHVG